MDLWTDLFQPCVNFVISWLTLPVTFAGLTVPVWSFFAFALLLGLFVRVIEFISGVRIDSGEGDIHDFHIDGFH